MVGISVTLGAEVRAIRADGSRLQFKTWHEAALLGALALAAPDEFCRESLAAALWPDSERTMARQNLRQRLATLRRLVGDALKTDRQTVRLSRPPFSTVVESDHGEMVLACQALIARARMGQQGIGQQGMIQPKVLTWSEIDAEIRSEGAPLFLAPEVRLRSLEFALDASKGWEQRVGAAIAGATGAGTDHAESVLQIPLSLRRDCPTDPAAHRAMAFLHQQAARIAHIRGDWHLSIIHERESVRRYAEGLHPVGRAWATFRTIRKSIDLDLNAQNYQQLCDMKRLSRLPGRLLGFIEMNLVHAGALRGDWETADQAFANCLSRPEIQNGAELASWLRLNRAILQCVSGSPRQALISLEEASQTTGMHVPVDQCFWQWGLGVQVFARLNETSSAALLCTLAERVRQPLGIHHTPTNQRALKACLEPLVRSQAPGLWLDAVAEAQAIPIAESHAHYCHLLRATRRAYAV